MLSPRAPSDHHMQTSSQQVPRINKGKVDVIQQKPNGVLAVHLKELRIMNGDFVNAFDHDQVNVYVRIVAGGNIKSSCVHLYTAFPFTICMDDLKHFFIQINPTRGHSDNSIRMELVGYDRRDVHRVLSRKVIHSHDLVKNQFVVDTCKFVRAEKVFAEVDAEYCFSYGVFGYGYSNQLQNNLAAPRDQITHSMFCRCIPPADRTRGRGAPDVMTSIPVGHPAFINFTGKAELVDLKMEFGEDNDIEQYRMIEDPMILISKMRKRMHLLQDEFSSQTSRKRRLLYLKKLIRNDHLMADNSDEICVTQGGRMKRRVAKTDSTMGEKTSATAVNPEEEEVSFNVNDVSRIMSLAPGVVGKKPFQEESIKTTRVRRSVMPAIGKIDQESYELLEAITVTSSSDYVKNPELMIDRTKPDERRMSSWNSFRGVFKATQALFSWSSKRRDSTVGEHGRKDSMLEDGKERRASQSRKDSVQENGKERRASKFRKDSVQEDGKERRASKFRKDSVQEDEENQGAFKSRKDSVKGEVPHEVIVEEPEAGPSNVPDTSSTSVTTDEHQVHTGKRRSTLAQLTRFIFGSPKAKRSPASQLNMPRLSTVPSSVPFVSSDEESGEDTEKTVTV